MKSADPHNVCFCCSRFHKKQWWGDHRASHYDNASAPPLHPHPRLSVSKRRYTAASRAGRQVSASFRSDAAQSRR